MLPVEILKSSLWQCSKKHWPRPWGFQAGQLPHLSSIGLNPQLWALAGGPERTAPGQWCGLLHGPLWRLTQRKTPDGRLLASCVSCPISFWVNLMPGVAYCRLTRPNVLLRTPKGCYNCDSVKHWFPNFTTGVFSLKEIITKRNNNGSVLLEMEAAYTLTYSLSL